MLKGYDDIAVYFRTEGINSTVITKKEDQEEGALRKNNSTNVIVFDKTSLPVKKAKETATALKEVLHPVGKVGVAIAVAERIINLLDYALKCTNSFGLTVISEVKRSMTSKEELKGIYKRLLKELVVNKQYYGKLLTVFRRNLSNILNYSFQGNVTNPYNFLAIKHLMSLLHLYVKSKFTE